MSLWAFRFILWYLCILFVQPQNRFLFLHPFHIADIAVMAALVFHVFSCLTENKAFIRFGPATIIGLSLFVAGLLSQYLGIFQISSRWSTHIDLLAKSILLMIMVEATAISVQRCWAVLATMMLATLWWVKAGLRLSSAGATYSLDRIMGPAVSIIDNPNGYAYMMCVMIPLYLYFFRQVQQKYIKWGFLALVLSAVYIVLQTGSRTGLLILMAGAIFMIPKYAKEHILTLVIIMVGLYFILSYVSPGNIKRFETIPKSIIAALSGDKAEGDLSQDEQSAQARHLKNKDTWALIKEYPLFGVGIYPDQSRFVERFPNASGQVHCEILMAGKQMGLIGMGLYVTVLWTIIIYGRRLYKQFQYTWCSVSDLGWTLQMQGVLIVVGGAFSPLPWNVVTLVLCAISSSLWKNTNSYSFGQRDV